MGGLCNRLRTILSYRAAYGSLEVEWLPIQVGAGTWDEVFEPLEGVTFVTPGPWTLRHQGGPVLVHYSIMSNEWAVKSELRGQADEPTWADCNPLASAPMGWQTAYRDVRLVPKLREALPDRPYSAVHVRRTDHEEMAKSWGVWEGDDPMYAWIRTDAGPRFYIATDNRHSQDRYAEAVRVCGGTALVARRIYPTLGTPADGENRATPLAHAAIDLFACVRADRFKGTPGSSFTATIELLRSMQGWWAE